MIAGGRWSGWRRCPVGTTLEELQADLDIWVKHYNEQRPHTGKYCFGKTPMQTCLDSIPMAKAKALDSTLQTVA